MCKQDDDSTRPLAINYADRDQLMQILGVSKKIANTFISIREIQNTVDGQIL